MTKSRPIYSAGEWTGCIGSGWAICHSRRLALALLGVPKHSREAICLIVSVVFRRRRMAIATFFGSLWRRAAKSSGFQPRRRSSPGDYSVPLATALSHRCSPL